MSLKLIILGLLMEGEKHPYEVQQLVKMQGMDCYIKYAKGSFYYAFDQMEKAQLIEVADVIKESNRPDKRTYRITESGREEFQRLLVTEMKKPLQLNSSVYSALTFARHGDQTEMEKALQENMQEIQKLLELLESIQTKRKETLDWGANMILIGTIEHLKTEYRWLQRIQAEGWGK